MFSGLRIFSNLELPLILVAFSKILSREELYTHPSHTRFYTETLTKFAKSLYCFISFIPFFFYVFHNLFVSRIISYIS